MGGGTIRVWMMRWEDLAFYSIAFGLGPMSGGCADSSNEDDWMDNNNRRGFTPAFATPTIQSK